MISILQVNEALPESPVVTLVSINPIAATSKMEIFITNAPVSTVGLIGIAYTSESKLTYTDIADKLTGAQFEIRNYISQSTAKGLLILFSVGDNSPTSQSDQMCTAVNSKSSDRNFIPCEKRIVFAMDISSSIGSKVFGVCFLFPFFF